MRALAASSNEFGFDLYRRLDGAGNRAIAPASIAIALGMTAGGARGQTLTEMRAVLRHTLPEAELHAAWGALVRRSSETRAGFTLATAQRLFVHTSLALEAPFVALTQNNYGAAAERVDFAQFETARALVNQWVATRTRDRITGILPEGSVGSDTRVVLVSAMYLNGRWRRPFAEADTRPETFHTPTQPAQVPMMRMTRDLYFAEIPGGKMLEMPYADGDYVMDVILPNAAGDLPALASRLNTTRLTAWSDELSTRRVNVRLPRFRVDGAILPLRDTLQGPRA